MAFLDLIPDKEELEKSLMPSDKELMLLSIELSVQKLVIQNTKKPNAKPKSILEIRDKEINKSKLIKEYQKVNMEDDYIK